MCEQPYCTKFEYEGMKTAGVTDHPLNISDGQSPTALKNIKKNNVHKIRGAHVQCMNNHYVKLNIKE